MAMNKRSPNANENIFIQLLCAFEAKPVNCLTISETKAIGSNSCRNAEFRLSSCYENKISP